MTDRPAPEPNDPHDLVRHLRELIRDRDRAIAEDRSDRRELAIAKAGINTTTKLGTLFVKSYAGPLEAAAIRREAADLGLGVVVAQTPAAPPSTAPSTPAPSARPDAIHSRRHGIEPL